MFFDKTFYLFDTFEGFDRRDIQTERLYGYSNVETSHFSITSTEYVLSKLPNRHRAIVKKGYFPETFDLQNECFCFVNLDMDLYQPTLAGLNLYFPLMSKGGIILVHDYFSIPFSGVKSAVNEFARSQELSVIPIGDFLSIAIVK